MGNHMSLDPKTHCVTVVFPKGDNDKVSVDVPIKATGNSRRVAERVAWMCFSILRDGASKDEAIHFRNEILKGYRRGEEAPDESESWEVCKVSSFLSKCPVVAFDYQVRDGSKFHFQTTKGAAGTILEA